MKNIFLGVLIGVFAPIAQGQWERVYQDSLQNIVILNTRGSMCTATIIEGGLLLTADHCVKKLYTVQFRLHDDKDIWRKADVVWRHPKLDVALVRPQESLERPFAEFRTKEVVVGEEMLVIGHPIAIDFFADPFYKEETTYVASRGIVSRVTEDEILTDHSVSPGNSGGPVIDRDGKIVAVVSRKRVGVSDGFINTMVLPQALPRNKSSHKIEVPQDPLPWWRANSGFRLEISAVSNSLLSPKSLKEGRDDYLDLSLGYSFASRLWIFAHGDLANHKSFTESSLRLGWNTLFTFDHHINLNLIPQIGFTDTIFLDADEQSRRVRDTAIGFKMDLPLLPFGFDVLYTKKTVRSGLYVYLSF